MKLGLPPEQALFRIEKILSAGWRIVRMTTMVSPQQFSNIAFVYCAKL